MASIANERPIRHARQVEERRPGLFTRLREWLAREPEIDWAESEPIRPTSAIPPQQQTAMHPPTVPVPAQRPQHPPFGMKPAYSAHVLDRLIHKMVELRADPQMTAMIALERLYDLHQELSRLAQLEFDMARRMERNAADVAAQTALLADAERRGQGAEAVEQAVAGIAGRAAHVAAEDRTGVLPVITEDMPDPRTVGQPPADVSPGDAEQPVSPVHVDDDTTPPLPSEEFLSSSAGGSVPSALADRAMGLRTPQAPQDDEAMAGTQVAS